MPGQAGSRRLVATLILSVVLHLVLLAWLPRGLSGSGGPPGSAIQSPRRNASLAPLGFPADALISSATWQALEGAIEGLVAGESFSGLPDDLTRPAATETGIFGLPILETETMGPSYPPSMPTYLPASMLERPPQALTGLDEGFAQLERIAGAGYMVFSLLIDEDGKVEEVLNEYSSLEQVFVGTVQATLEKMRFAPGTKDNKTVKARVRIEVNFGYSVFGAP